MTEKVDATATVFQDVIVTPAVPEGPAEDPTRRAARDQALLAGQEAVAAVHRYCQELRRAYPELAGRIYGQDPLPAGSNRELETVYEDMDTVLRGMGAIEEIATWLYPEP